MKKYFFIIILLISVFLLSSCDYRKKLSNEKCEELYNFIEINLCNDEGNEYLYYDYSCELLLINKNGKIHSNKDIKFLENYDYSKTIDIIKYIINNYKPLNINGYEIDSQVQYTINVEYDFKLLQNELNINIKSLNLAIYKNSNFRIELEIYDEQNNPYKTGIIIGDVDLSKYEDKLIS